MSDTHFDVIVLGAGPGGYLAAERLGHAGKKVALVEEQYLGGTCLNVGCIPTKTLLNGAKNYLHAKEASQFGVDASGVAVNWTQMQAWKDQVVKGLVAGVAATERKAGVTVINGRGHLDAPGRVSVEGTTYTSDHVIIATGSVPAMPPLPGTQDNPALVDSTGILSLPEVPARLAIIGGGVIGVEFASLYSTLGSQVTVIEMAPETEGWGAKEAGLEINRGIVVDDTMRTNLPNVWAIGDVTGRSLLAHAAYRMAEIASANILDPSAKKRGEVMRWHTVPWAVFSIPEAAGVGLTESAAKREGRDVLVAKVPALMSGRFIAENGFKAPGEAKILVDPKTHQVLGIHVLGAYAAEMIWGAQAVLEMELTVEDLRQVVFPHPTVSEVIREAAWAVKL